MKDSKTFYPVSLPLLGGRELEYVVDAVESGWVSSLGTYVSRFEMGFAKFCGVEHAICVANGTVALHLALHARGIGAGDEIIMPDLSFIATANAALLTGAKPVFCDVDVDSLCIDPALIENLITSRTKAILPVHLYGHPANMDAVMEIAKRYGLFVIEDSAEAHGSSVGGRRVGGLADCATFSFYANKNMTTGEGGMITTNDDELAYNIRELRDHAMSKSKRYWHNHMGFNYRMTNMQAALGCAQLEQVEGFLARRRAIFAGYASRLADVPGIRLNREAEGTTNSYWMICAEFTGVKESVRDVICSELLAMGVDNRPYFYPMSKMPFLDGPANTPVAESVSACGINLPTYVQLTDDDLDSICDSLRKVLAEHSPKTMMIE